MLRLLSRHTGRGSTENLLNNRLPMQEEQESAGIAPVRIMDLSWELLESCLVLESQTCLTPAPLDPSLLSCFVTPECREFLSCPWQAVPALTQPSPSPFPSLAMQRCKAQILPQPAAPRERAEGECHQPSLSHKSSEHSSD